MYHTHFSSGIDLGKAFIKAWLLDKINKPTAHIVSNPPHCRHYHSLSKTLSGCFQTLPFLFCQCQPHQITENLGYLLNFIIINIKSSNSQASRSQHQLCTITIPMPPSLQTQNKWKPFGSPGSFQNLRSLRSAHRTCTFMEAAARFQVWQTSALCTALTHAGRGVFTQATYFHISASQNRRASAASLIHTFHGHVYYKKWKWTVKEVILVACKNE